MSQLVNTSNGQTLANFVEVASTFAQRNKGLLGRETLDSNRTLWIHKCPSIHTFFMKFRLDVIFVDRNLKVTSVHRDVGPWRLIFYGGWGAKDVFEFTAGALSNREVQPGDQLNVID
ncbi:MAG: DUF192 domain-containing protein [Bdellovibrionales bacterium]|nr:DUF192 domain-containing protein [Bdellovibrionales bacterium]